MKAGVRLLAILNYPLNSAEVSHVVKRVRSKDNQVGCLTRLDSSQIALLQESSCIPDSRHQRLHRRKAGRNQSLEFSAQSQTRDPIQIVRTCNDVSPRAAEFAHEK